MFFEPYPDQIEVLKKVRFTKTENILELSKSTANHHPPMMPVQPGDNSLGALNLEKYLTRYGVKYKVKQETGRTFIFLTVASLPISTPRKTLQGIHPSFKAPMGN